ncbi:MAG: helix-turn-helix domain-containing protein [Puniceicoccales bacterium]|nr:helix-turn-helix domain-containing protein [Puniceicoccales bacterium]
MKFAQQHSSTAAQQHSSTAAQQHSSYSKLLNVQEAAAFLSIKKHTLEDWIYSNRYPGLKSVKLGGARRFREQDLVEFIESRMQTTTVGKRGENE